MYVGRGARTRGRATVSVTCVAACESERAESPHSVCSAPAEDAFCAPSVSILRRKSDTTRTSKALPHCATRNNAQSTKSKNRVTSKINHHEKPSHM